MAIEESDDEQDIEEEYDSHHAFMFNLGPPTKIADMVQSAGSDLTDALKVIDQLKAERMKFEEEKDEEIKRLKAQLQEKKIKEIKVQFSEEEFPPLGNSQIARPFMEAEAHYS
uniref:Uncharacterized protein n=1 Tax=Tanacetum cinerariifolium TaxID=118510 RepID=A0A699S556_TANCI|nr:hypothetical protein [Tanacetum cinerariifolium]